MLLAEESDRSTPLSLSLAHRAKEAANAAQDDATKQAGWETIYETEPSEQMTNPETSQDLWKLSTALTGASWLPAYQPKSPCPTLVVVGAITKVNTSPSRHSPVQTLVLPPHARPRP